MGLGYQIFIHSVNTRPFLQQHAAILVPDLATPKYEALPSRVFRLRWRFDFADKPTKRGIWNAASPNPRDQASSIPKAGLVCAAIEAEHYETQELTSVVECQGPDFGMFLWEAYARCPGLLGIAEFKPRTNIAGLTMVTRSERITVYINGTWNRRPLTDEEKQFKFNEFK